MAITDNLVSYWKLDESSGNAADSVGSNTATNTNVTYSSGKLNNGAVFNGTSASYAVANATGFNPTTAFSISMWVKITNTGADDTVIGKPYSSYADPWVQWSVRHLSGRPYFCFSTGGSGTQVGAYADTTLSTGVWYHSVVTYDGSNIRWYLNGVANGTTARTGTIQTLTTDVSIGKFSTTYFDGMMDEVGIWDRALTAAEVAYLYNNGRGVQYPNMQFDTLGEYLGAGSGITKGLYHLNGSSADYSGNGNNGTDTSVTYGLASGKLGMGVALNSSHNSLISFTNVLPTTLSFWMNMVAMHSGATGYNLFTDSGVTTTIQGSGTDGKILIYDGANRTATNAWSVGSWVNYVFVYTTSGGNGYNIYLNGNFLEKLTVGSQVNVGKIGRTSGGSFSPQGSLDEIIMENVAWDAAKIKKYYEYSKGRFGII